MDQPAFFLFADNLQLPSGGGLQPLGEDPSIIAVTHGAGSHHARSLHGKTLYRTMKATQRLQCPGHRLRIEASIMKHAFAKARDFTILMQWDEAALAQFGDTQSN